jgi:hypothetical protein
MQIAAILLEQDRIYLLRATMEDVIKQIPEAAEYIGKMLTTSEPNEPLYQL